MVMAKIVNAALEAKAIGPEAKTIKIGLEAKDWPQVLHHWPVRYQLSPEKSQKIDVCKVNGLVEC